MCNDYRLEVDIASIAEDFESLQIKIKMPEGTPNVPAREDIKITDMAPILRSVEGERGIGELVNRRWSWPGPRGKPVYNFRSEGRAFSSHRCLILADGFYEFTASADPKVKRKERWLFTWPDHDWFGIAGIRRADSSVGEAFTMLTCPPGPDILPYHNRQVVLLSPENCLAWLDPSRAAQEFTRPLPQGTLEVNRSL